MCQTTDLYDAFIFQHRESILKPHIVVIRLMFLSIFALFLLNAEARTVNIGVLAFRPKIEVETQYAPLIALLKQSIPEYDFKILPCNYQELESRVANAGEIDFVLTNPAHYVQLSKRFEMTAPLATLINTSTAPLTKFGGVILTRADRNDIRTLADLKHKKIAGVASESFGGFQVQAYALTLVGLRQPDDYQLQYVGMPHDVVVKQVIDGRFDAGFVRTGVVEGMIKNGLLMPSQFKIINPQHMEGFHQFLSTPLYPEWPLVAMTTVDEKLVRHLTATVLDFNPPAVDQNVSSQYFFATPSIYTPVEVVLRELRLPPFDHTPEFTLFDIWSRYGLPLALTLIFGILTLLLSARLIKVNSKLSIKKKKLDSEIRLRSGLLNTMGEGVYGVDHSGICTITNPAAQKMLGYTESEMIGVKVHQLFHHHHTDGKIYEDYDCPVMQTLRDGKSRSCEDWFIRKDGTGFFVALTVSANTMSDSNHGGAVIVFHDITARKMEEKRVRHMAHHDALTNLPNRILFDDRLTQALSMAKRDRLPVALMFVDLDKFKPINDTFGHQTGDLLLMAVARRLLGCLRDSDTAARIGGDEFVVLLPTVQTLEDAAHVADKILTALREPFNLEGISVQISASIGVAVDFINECDSIELKNRADCAMYRAKELGRNNVSIYHYEQPHVLNWSI